MFLFWQFWLFFITFYFLLNGTRDVKLYLGEEIKSDYFITFWSMESSFFLTFTNLNACEENEM